VEALVDKYDICNGTIEIGCDCESALTAIFDHTYDTPRQPHHDLIHAIRIKLASSPVTWIARHVRGHQDKHVPIHLLDMWSQLNVEMDSLAKTYWNQMQPTIQPFYPATQPGWSLWIGQRKLSNWDRVSLYNHAQKTDILAHWSKRRGIPENLITSINWEACENAVKRLGLNRALWVPKWLAGYAPVGKVMKRYKFQTHDECPRCSEFEDTIHVIRCESQLATTQWDSSIATLDAWLFQVGTMPDLRHAIVTRLKAWKTHSPQIDPQYTWPGVNDLVKKQDLVGWRSFLEGCILHEWAAKQQAYYDWLKRKNTGKRWTTTLIKKLWEVIWDMWQQRNDELKNPTSLASLREHARLDLLISADYANIRRLSLKDRRWFRRPKEVVYTESIDYKNQWLESVSLARARYARRHRNDHTAERASMRHYLRRPHRSIKPDPL